MSVTYNTHYTFRLSINIQNNIYMLIVWKLLDQWLQIEINHAYRLNSLVMLVLFANHFAYDCNNVCA